MPASTRIRFRKVWKQAYSLAAGSLCLSVLKNFYTGIVTKVHETAPEAYETKDISEVLDSRPVFVRTAVFFLEMAGRLLPLHLGRRVQGSPAFGYETGKRNIGGIQSGFCGLGTAPSSGTAYSDLLSADPEQCVTQLEKASGMKNLLPVIKSLLEKEAICIKEEIKRSYKPRTEVRVRLTEALQNEHHLHIQFDLLARAPKQQAILMKYLELSGWNAKGENVREVSRRNCSMHPDRRNPSSRT